MVFMIVFHISLLTVYYDRYSIKYFVCLKCILLHEFLIFMLCNSNKLFAYNHSGSMNVLTFITLTSRVPH
jgi:hypothetical protein